MTNYYVQTCRFLGNSFHDKELSLGQFCWNYVMQSGMEQRPSYSENTDSPAHNMKKNYLLYCWSNVCQLTLKDQLLAALSRPTSFSFADEYCAKFYISLIGKVRFKRFDETQSSYQSTRRAWFVVAVITALWLPSMTNLVILMQPSAWTVTVRRRRNIICFFIYKVPYAEISTQLAFSREWRVAYQSTLPAQYSHHCSRECKFQYLIWVREYREAYLLWHSQFIMLYSTMPYIYDCAHFSFGMEVETLVAAFTVCNMLHYFWGTHVHVCNKTQERTCFIHLTLWYAWTSILPFVDVFHHSLFLERRFIPLQTRIALACQIFAKAQAYQVFAKSGRRGSTSYQYIW